MARIIEMAYTPATMLVSATDNTRACMDSLEQHFRHMRVFDEITICDGFDSAPVSGLPHDFKLLEIKRYNGKGRIHLRFTIVMMTHRLDET